MGRRGTAPDRGRTSAGRWSAAGTAVAAALVFGVTAGRLPLWRDEVAGVELAGRTLPQLWRALRLTDATHGLYYVLLHAMLRAGDAEAWLRLPSVVAAVATVVLAARVVQRRAGRAGALVTVALLLGNPFLGWYARDARPFALGLLAVTGVAALVLGSAPPGRALTAGTALAVLATYLHAFDALPALVLLAGRVLRDRRALGPWRPLAAAAGYAAAVAPLAVRVGHQTVQISWVLPLSVRDLAALAVHLAGWGVPALLVWVVLGVRAVLGARSGTPLPAGRTWFVAVAATAAAVPPALLMAVTLLARPVYVDHYVLPSTVLVAMAAGALATGWERGRAPAVAALVALSVPGIVLTAVGVPMEHEDLRGAARFVAASARPGDCVVYDPSWSRLGLTYYLRREHPGVALRDVALDPGPEGTSPSGLFARERPAAEVGRALDGCDRVWVAGYPGADTWTMTSGTGAAALTARDAQFSPAQWHTFGQLQVALRTRRT